MPQDETTVTGTPEPLDSIVMDDAGGDNSGDAGDKGEVIEEEVGDTEGEGEDGGEDGGEGELDNSGDDDTNNEWDSEGEQENDAGGDDEGGLKKAAGGNKVEEIKKFMNQRAKQLGLDLNDEAQRKIAWTMANQDWALQQEKLKSLTSREEDELTPFERELEAKPKDDTPPPPPFNEEVGDVIGAAMAGKINYAAIKDDDYDHPAYVFKPFKSAKEAAILELKALNSAAGEKGNGDFEPYEAVKTRVFVQRLGAVMPLLHRAFFSELEKQLPGLKDMVASTRTSTLMSQAHTQAITALKSTKGYERVEDLFKPDGGPPVKWQNQEFAPTPMNRIMARYPELRKIRVEHNDPAKAAVLTRIAVLRAAMKLHNTKSTVSDKKQVASLVKTGRDQERKKAATAENKGGLNSGKGRPTGNAADPYMDALRRAAKTDKLAAL